MVDHLQGNLKTMLAGRLLASITILIATACLPVSEEIASQWNTPLPADDLTPRLKIFVLDVGQGDATLLIGPDGTTVLIDAGPPLAGITQILPQLRALTVEAIDWALISHYDLDHLGGLLEILRGEDEEWETGDDLPIGTIWDRGGAPFDPTPWFAEYDEALTPHSRETVTIGQVWSLGNGATAQVILSDGDYLDGTKTHLNPDEENAASIALLIEYGDFRYLTAGDLTGGGITGWEETKDLETDLAAIVGPITILHINHHGSRTSTNENYLAELSPEAAIISAGQKNDYGHPHAEVLGRLEEHAIPTYETQDGTIRIETDGRTFAVEQE